MIVASSSRTRARRTSRSCVVRRRSTVVWVRSRRGIAWGILECSGVTPLSCSLGIALLAGRIRKVAGMLTRSGGATRNAAEEKLSEHFSAEVRRWLYRSSPKRDECLHRISDLEPRDFARNIIDDLVDGCFV